MKWERNVMMSNAGYVIFETRQDTYVEIVKRCLLIIYFAKMTIEKKNLLR